MAPMREDVHTISFRNKEDKRVSSAMTSSVPRLVGRDDIKND
jgi:hypothetical protein